MKEKNQAALLMLMSSFCFSAMAVVVKMSATSIGTIQQVFFRNLFSMFIAIYLLKKYNLPFLPERRYYVPVLARTLFGFVGLIILFYGTRLARQADVAVLNRSVPIWTTICAAIWFKEKISKVQIPVIAICLLGTFIIMQPSFDSDWLPLACVLTTAIMSGPTYCILSYCKGRVHPLTVIFCFSTFSTVFDALLMIPSYVAPSPKEWIMLLFIGIFAAGGQIGLTYSCQKAPASEVTVYEYSGIPFSMIMGYVLLGEELTVSSVFGAILITAGGLWSYLYNRRESMKEVNNH